MMISSNIKITYPNIIRRRKRAMISVFRVLKSMVWDLSCIMYYAIEIRLESIKNFIVYPSGRFIQSEDEYVMCMLA
jgi:predicted proteasome-type protease